MLVKEFTYTDYFGNERTEKCYFNLTKTEITEMNFSRKGGLDKVLEHILETRDETVLMKEFKYIVLSSYGEKSEDGRRLMKSKEISKAFEETPMYDLLMQELLTDENKAASFVNQIIPYSSENPKLISENKENKEN